MMLVEPRTTRGWYRAGELRRRPGETLGPFTPPAPLLYWRDVQHRGLMRSGMCVVCFGFIDDPRHTGSALATASYAGEFNASLALYRRA